MTYPPVRCTAEAPAPGTATRAPEEPADIGRSGRRLDDAEWVDLHARHDQYPA